MTLAQAPRHDGNTKMDTRNSGIERKPLPTADRGRLEILCHACTDFFEVAMGQPGGMETAEEILGALPANVTSGRKSVYGLERAGELIGVVELLAGFPGPNEWYVGLLLLRPDERAGGTGTLVWVDLLDEIKLERGTAVRLIVQKQNPGARHFWERQGFAVEKEIVAKAGKLESPAWRMHLAESNGGGGSQNMAASERLMIVTRP